MMEHVNIDADLLNGDAEHFVVNHGEKGVLVLQTVEGDAVYSDGGFVWDTNADVVRELSRNSQGEVVATCVENGYEVYFSGELVRSNGEIPMNALDVRGFVTLSLIN